MSLNCPSWNTAKRGISRILDLYKIGIFCLSETWETDINKLNLENGWGVFSKSRTGAHGGVAMMRKPSEHFMVQRLEAYEVDRVEAICIKVITDTQNSFVVVNAYIPPGECDQIKQLIGIVEK